MRRIFILLAVWLSTAAPAGALKFCLGAFAGLTDEGRVALIRQTHRELMDSLGKGLTAEQLNRMIAEEKPFDAEGPDGLSKHLKDLKKMIRAQGWDTAEMRAALVADLKQRRSEAQTSGERVEAAVKKADARIVSLNFEGFSLAGPGRYMTMHRRTNGGDVLLYDVIEHRSLPPVKIPGMTNLGAQVSPAGDALVVPLQGAAYKLVPLENGVVHPERATSLGTPDPELGRGHLTFVAGGKGLAFISKSEATDPDLFRFDLKTGERTLVEYPGDEQSRRGAETKLAGNSGEFSVMTASTNTRPQALRRYAIDAAGKPAAVPGKISLPSGFYLHEWSPDGKKLVVITADMHVTQPPAGWRAIAIAHPVDESGERLHVYALLPHPTQETAVVVAKQGNHVVLVWYDLNTGSEIGRRSPLLAKGSVLRLSGDGEHFALKSPGTVEYFVGESGAIQP